MEGLGISKFIIPFTPKGHAVKINTVGIDDLQYLPHYLWIFSLRPARRMKLTSFKNLQIYINVKLIDMFLSKLFKQRKAL